RLSAQVRERVEVVQGALEDVDVVTKAFAGAESVFWLAPATPSAESIEGNAVRFTRPLCEAIKSQGVKRLVYVAGLRPRRATDFGFAAAARAMDELIDGTGV